MIHYEFHILAFNWCVCKWLLEDRRGTVKQALINVMRRRHSDSNSETWIKTSSTKGWRLSIGLDDLHITMFNWSASLTAVIPSNGVQLGSDWQSLPVSFEWRVIGHHLERLFWCIFEMYLVLYQILSLSSCGNNTPQVERFYPEKACVMLLGDHRR